MGRAMGCGAAGGCGITCAGEAREGAEATALPGGAAVWGAMLEGFGDRL